MLFRDGVYVERPDGSLRFRWVKAPTSTGSGWLTQALARRIGRYLERQGLLERDAENSYLAGDETATARHTSSYFGHPALRGHGGGWPGNQCHSEKCAGEPIAEVDSGAGMPV